MNKTFVGPRLRRLRTERGETQTLMARNLGISAAYVNLLENNQRSVSVQVLLRLFEAYGVDWRDIADDDTTTVLADLRAMTQDPIFEECRPDLSQLRAALVHSPTLATAFLKLHSLYRSASDQILSIGDAQSGEGGVLVDATPESSVHNFFRRNRNHFRELEEAATAFWEGTAPEADEIYSYLKFRLKKSLGLSVRMVAVEALPHTLRQYDERMGEIQLSMALDHPNRVFQLAHMYGLLALGPVLDQILSRSEMKGERELGRCRVELCNYFAAAALMPYDAFLTEARACKYDMDHLATRFGVSFEQACHRATTLNREGAQGVPFFFLRIDKAGNVSKRFNATDFHLAEFGGACPRLDIHSAFRMPGRIMPQFVEMPDQSQYLTFSRTVDRPSFERHSQDNRLAVTLGCTVEHASEICYAEEYNMDGRTRMTPIGINCRVCPRQNCDQRAYQATILSQPVDAMRRGATRFDS
jgi:predicted transcriptional regulator/DNA-binding XRE family transcriptional regulator